MRQHWRIACARAALALLALAVAAAAAATTTAPAAAQTTRDRRRRTVSGNVSIVGIWTGDEQKSFQAVLDGFKEKYPNVKVKYTPAGDNVPTVLGTAVAGRQPAGHRGDRAARLSSSSSRRRAR